MIYIFTHDSIGVGEDGPTHQPIEHLAALRAIPQLARDPARRRQRSGRGLAHVIMPINDQPVALVLTRQNLPTLDRTKYAAAAGVASGGYVLADAAGGKPSVILIGTGSEVLARASQAHEQLTAEGIAARVVSMPSWELFEAARRSLSQTACLPPDVTARVAVEAGRRARLGPLHRPHAAASSA